MKYLFIFLSSVLAINAVQATETLTISAGNTITRDDNSQSTTYVHSVMGYATEWVTADPSKVESQLRQATLDKMRNTYSGKKVIGGYTVEPEDSSSAYWKEEFNKLARLFQDTKLKGSQR